MKTSFIIPFKDEVQYAEITMRNAYLFLSERGIDFELVAVDDSSDGTWEILQSFEEGRENVVAVKGGNPPGYGKALRKGFTVATGDIIIPFNGDLSDSLDDALAYIQLIENGYEMVFGSRFIAGATATSSAGIKGFISQLGNAFIQLLFCTNSSDMTNSFKAYRKMVIEDIKPTENGYNIGIEIALKGILKKYKYTTIPISCLERKYGESKMSILKTIPSYLSTALKIRFFKTL
ncbi:MAG: glycosyltransferase [Oscillatoria sp. SIO1A7]|nr:glycosyltransferase [Oscillatoria sp. SIO1A7]